MQSWASSISRVAMPRQQHGDLVRAALVVSKLRPKPGVRTRRRLRNQPGAPHDLADVRKVELKADDEARARRARRPDRKSTRLNSSHLGISYAVFCLKK